MDLDSKYELGAVIANDGESKTFRARESASGREVFVHILFGGKPPGGGESLLSILLARLTDPDPAKRAQIIEINDYKGMPLAVTEMLPDFQGMRAWIEKQRAPRPAAAPPVPDPQAKAGVWKVPPASAAPGIPTTPEDEFDRLFGAQTASPDRPSPAAPAPPPPAAPTPGARPEGEFTRLFRATLGDSPAPPAPPAPPVAAPPPRPPATVAPPPPPGPAFAPAPPPARTASAPPPPAESGPGEFTRMFQSERLPETPAMPVPPSPPPMPLRQADSAPGEFTRLFQAAEPSGGSVPPPQPPPASGQPGGFTGLFSSPSSAPASAVQPPPGYGMPPQSPLPDYGMPQGSRIPGGMAPPASGKPAGEFTQLFGAPGTQGGAAPLAPAAPPPPAEASGATGVFSMPAAGLPPAARAQSGPGEYTSIFGAQSSYAKTDVAPFQAKAEAPQPPIAAPPPGMAPAPVARPQIPLLPVVIITAVVLLAALGLLLYFLSRR